MDAGLEDLLDRRSAWLVVAGVAYINMTNQSILSVFGLLFGTQLLQMQNETFTVALITNLNSLAQNFSGLFIGPVIERFKPKTIATLGCLMVSFGLVLCAFANQGWQFIIGYSLFVGIGLGLISPSTFMVINSCFYVNRGRAVGVSLAGAGVGQIILPHLVRVFLEYYGFRTAVLSVASMSLTGMFGALLLRPYPLPATPAHCQSLIKALDLELLRDPIFISIIVGLALVYTSTINFTMIFPIFLQNSVGLSSSVTATCLSISAGADITFRLLLPCITDKLQLSYRNVFLFGTIGLLLSRTALAESTDLTSIIVMSVFTGITKSATVLNNNLTISEHCRPENLAGGLGLNMISKGLFVITIGQLLGWIRDYTASYKLALHAQNLCLLFVIFVWTPEICYRLWKQRKYEKVALLKSNGSAKLNGF